MAHIATKSCKRRFDARRPCNETLGILKTHVAERAVAFARTVSDVNKDISPKMSFGPRVKTSTTSWSSPMTSIGDLRRVAADWPWMMVSGGGGGKALASGAAGSGTAAAADPVGFEFPATGSETGAEVELVRLDDADLDGDLDGPERDFRGFATGGAILAASRPMHGTQPTVERRAEPTLGEPTGAERTELLGIEITTSSVPNPSSDAADIGRDGCDSAATGGAGNGNVAVGTGIVSHGGCSCGGKGGSCCW
mmetsp:Transcript_89204/g.257169  ORF Transcript_89204/g.257169 Transcript_89204/m.257169 type:complete len:252 (+) Transcript_89204:1582-2337(+)